MATFIKLTALGHGTIYLNLDLATYIHAEPDGSYGHDKGVKSAVNILGSQGGATYQVHETPEQILALIEAARKDHSNG